MMRYLLPLLCLFSAALHADPLALPVPASAPPVPGKIQWCNGESLPGELLEATGNEVTWKSPLFEEPLQLNWRALRRIDEPQAAVPASDPFSIALRDGSFIYGDLVSVAGKTVSIHSARHGDVALDRSEVLAVRKLKGGNLIFSGPIGDVGWTTQANPRRMGGFMFNASVTTGTAAPLASGPDGALLMPYWNRSASFDVNIPELSDVEFRVRSSKRPDFQFSIEGGSKNRLRVETWEDELILASGDEFKFIRKITDDERNIALRICWDRKAKKCSVFTPGGKLLRDWIVPDDSQSGSSKLTLQNKGRDLALEFFRVRTWDGKPPAETDATKPRVELADGRIATGEITAGATGFVQVKASGEDAPQNIALRDVDAVIFSDDPATPRDHAFTLSYSDGTMISGDIESIKDGQAALTTSFTSAPLTTFMDALRQLTINTPMPYGPQLDNPLETMDSITVQMNTLHGKLTSAGDNWPRWLAVGGSKPVTPSRKLSSEIKRAFPADTEIPASPALFYTVTGDILPGALRSIDRSGAEFDSDFIEVKKIPPENLDAIQFGTEGKSGVRDFDDTRWRIVKGDEKSVKKTKETLSMDPGTSVYHPSVLQAGEIKFVMDAQNFAVVRLRLFCSGTDSTQTPALIVALMGNAAMAGIEASEGQLDSQMRLQVPPGQPLSVRLVVHEKEMEVFLNNVSTEKIPVDSVKRAGTGLIVEPASVWGNSVNPVLISHFAASSKPGVTWLPGINAEAKTQALTVPRFRKDDPPRQALLAANGDVLRGEIEAATSAHFAFRSGLENLNVPRDRVKAVIWLKKPAKDAPPPAPENPILKRLERKIQMRTRYSSSNLSGLLSFFQQEASDLKFKLPEKEDPRRFPMQYGGQTIGQALDQICSLFDLRYRVDKDGTIVFEPLAQFAGNFSQKAYWLKTAAFADPATVKETLAAKGVTFPEGSSVLWQPATKRLEMANTTENQEFLARLLESDFGGSFGSPTHWLILASGARLGLAVEKFDQDYITGHHPLYGQCRIPMSQVYAIRTSMPDQSVTMKSLHDWNLVYAPEPVLPEAGGENSLLLGKDAKTFKLQMLDGGEFDLAKEKGNVVILDFWATWCGPCVKSLPGLIDAMSAFPADKVKLIGVNQAEPPAQVKRFLETRGWKLTVAMDAGQSVARQYGVDGIPHTVIVGPDGKVAWVKTGYSPDGETEVSNAVKKLLAPASAVAPAAQTTQ